MGTDTPLAVLSQRPRLLYDYFKQLFAQVTNPPLDAIREELVTSMESTIGPERNLLRAGARVVPADRHQVPDHRQRRAGEGAAHRRCRASARSRCRCCMPRPKAAPGLERALDALKRQAREAVADGHTVLILSDRGVSRELAPIPSLLATAGVHHHLVREGHAHALRAGRRDRRRPRSAPRRAAHRLRRRRGESRTWRSRRWTT